MTISRAVLAFVLLAFGFGAAGCGREAEAGYYTGE